MKRNEEELNAITEKLSVVRKEIGDLFEEHDLDMGEVVSLLMSMLVQIGCDTVPALTLVSALAQGCKAYESMQETEEERESIQWLN